jgi:hypothetical protein
MKQTNNVVRLHVAVNFVLSMYCSVNTAEMCGELYHSGVSTNVCGTAVIIDLS